jgi:gamma-D-glutamyl-L-lysine dipeptidyl-peptidase
MEYGIVAVPAAPVRRKARHQREMVSQLLFGERVKIIKQKNDLWVKVRSLHDGYEGWMTITLLKEINETEAKAQCECVTTGMLNTITIQGVKMNLPIGCSLAGMHAGRSKVGQLEYEFAGNFCDRKQVKVNSDTVRELTAQWLNAPYMWGGRTIFGVDCSGFVQVNYKMMGIDLSRDAWQQAQQGKTVSKLKDAVCGDLAFFDDKDEIVHVGILLSPDQIIHASGKVRIDPIDKKGIIHSDSKKRTHLLRSIKRYW